MIVLEGKNDLYMPVSRIAEGSGEADIYLCENQKSQKFAGKICKKGRGLNLRVRDFLFNRKNDCFMKLVDYGKVSIDREERSFEIYEYISEKCMAQAVPFDRETLEKVIIPEANEALHTLHLAGFLHRDIKPDNMYLVHKGGRTMVVLGDFGICVPVNRDGNYQDSGLAFTPGYVPAEVLRGQTYSAASDYYALAVSLYYLMTGHQIYEGMSPDEIMVRTRKGDIASFSNMDARMARLLEGLMVQDPRYRWGYKEVLEWISGADVPVFNYSVENQELNPSYRLTAQVNCKTLSELAEAVRENPEEGKSQFYEGILADNLGKQYPYLKNALHDAARKFARYRNAGLSACIKILNPDVDGFIYQGVCYENLQKLSEHLADELSEGSLGGASEELLLSGILSYWYSRNLSAEKLDFLGKIEKTAHMDPLKAAGEFVLGLADVPYYRPERNVRICSVDEYIYYLEKGSGNLNELIFRDFNREYFAQWLGAIGLGAAFADWKNYFYDGNSVPEDEFIVGNACQFLEKNGQEGIYILRDFVRNELETSPEYWISTHTGLYRTDEMMEQMIQENFSTVVCDDEMTVPEIMQRRHEMREYMDELRRDFLNNPELYHMNIYDEMEYRILSESPQTYFVQNDNQEFVPAGWAFEYGTMKDRIQAQNAFDDFAAQAVGYMEQLEKRIEIMTGNVRDEIEELKRSRRNPGLPGAVSALVVSVILFFFWWKLCNQYLVDGGILTIAGFSLIFLFNMLLLIAGVIRINLYRLWKRLCRGPAVLEEISETVRERRMQLIKDAQDPGYAKRASQEMAEPLRENPETAAWAERARLLYLARVKNLKNGLARFLLPLFLAFAILTAGLYMDGSIEFSAEYWKEEVNTLFDGGFFNGLIKKGTTLGASDTTCTVSASKARLREGPGTSYDILNSYSNGTEMTLTGNSQSDGSYTWYEMTAPDGMTGWMRSDTISK